MPGEEPAMVRATSRLTSFFQRWSPSPLDVLKLNMDAALKSWWEIGFL